jgi:hypothetical protein
VRHSPNQTVGVVYGTRSTFWFFGTELAQGMAHKPFLFGQSLEFKPAKAKALDSIKTQFV